MKCLKVASVYSNMIIGGDHVRLLEYLGARDRDRFDHVVITGMSPSKELEGLCGPILDRFRDLDVATIDVGIPAGYLRWKQTSFTWRTVDQTRTFVRLIHRTARLLRELEIDIVEGRCDMGTLMATLAGRLAGVKTVISTNYFPQLERFRSPVWALVGQAMYTLVDAIICDSVTGLDGMRKWMKFPPPGYHIPNGIARPTATRTREEMTADLNIPPCAKVIAQIARIQPYKGQDLLLEAAPMVLAKVPDAFFLVCGYTGYTQQAVDFRDRLDLIVSKHGIGNRTRIISYPGSIGDIWSLVHLHVHPTLHDSSPIALLEGMSLGKPAVTTRIGGIHELVVNGETGIVLPPGDLLSLTDSIIRLLQNPSEATRMGRNAQIRYEANYRPEIMARRIEDLFEQVYDSPRIRCLFRSSN